MGCIAIRKLLGHRVIAIPDATSVVGSALVKALQNFETPVVIYAGVPPGPNAQKHLHELGRNKRVAPSIVPPTLLGIRQFLNDAHVLFVSASSASLTSMRQFLSIAYDMHIQHIVLQTWVLASLDDTNALHHLETYLQDLRPMGPTWTIIRLPFLLDFFTEHEASIRLSHQVVGGIPSTMHVPVIGLDDAAVAAATILAKPTPHAGLKYNLVHASTSALSMSEITNALSTAMEWEIAYRQVTRDVWIASWAEIGTPRWFVDFVPLLTAPPNAPESSGDDALCQALHCFGADQSHFVEIVGRPPKTPLEWCQTPKRFQLNVSFPTRFFVVGLNDRLGAQIATTLRQATHAVRGCDNILGTRPVVEDIPGVDWVDCKLERQNDVYKALRNTDVLVLLPSRSTSATVFPSILRGAKKAHVSGIILLSHEFAASNAWDSPFLKLKHIEELVQSSEIPYCIGRISMLMEVTLDWRKELLRRNHSTSFVKDDCLLGLVAATDVVQAMVRIASQFPLHKGRVYSLRADEVSFADMKEAMHVADLPTENTATQMDIVVAELGDIGITWWSGFHFVDYVYWCNSVEPKIERGENIPIAWALAFDRRPLRYANWVVTELDDELS